MVVRGKSQKVQGAIDRMGPVTRQKGGRAITSSVKGRGTRHDLRCGRHGSESIRDRSRSPRGGDLGPGPATTQAFGLASPRIELGLAWAERARGADARPRGARATKPGLI